MKKSYQKLILIMISTLIILFINYAFVRITSKYAYILLLLCILLLVITFIGNEKKKTIYVKKITIEILINLLMFFILYYLSGLLIGFYRNGNYLNYSGIINFILPIILLTIIEEYLRYIMISKSSESKILKICVCILFILIDINAVLIVNPIASFRDFFLLFALSILPIISKNVLNTYLSLNYGYVPAIVYALVMDLYSYLLPIIPSPNKFLYSIIFFVLPLLILYRLINFSKQLESEPIYAKVKNQNILYMIPFILMSVTLIYFVSGYFRYYLVAVGSGSMETVFYKGDCVIIDQKYNNVSDLEEKDIIAFTVDGTMIIHRIDKMIDDNGTIYIYTKGDNNEARDNWVVDNTKIIGKVKFIIPVIGYPTIWISELW